MIVSDFRLKRKHSEWTKDKYLLFLARLGAGGKLIKEAARCPPLWNPAAKNLFQSSPLSGSTVIWV